MKIKYNVVCIPRAILNQPSYISAVFLQIDTLSSSNSFKIFLEPTQTKKDFHSLSKLVIVNRADVMHFETIFEGSSK